MTIASVNPATNETLKRFAIQNLEQVKRSIERADKAFRQWKKTTFDTRKQILLDFANLLRERSEEFARLISLDMGKRITESRYEIDYCARIAEFYAQGAEGFLANEPLQVDGVEAYIQYAPLGVLLGIMPWNFPFYQVVRFATPNIMAGNTVLIKHASNVPQCAEAIESAFRDAGLPQGVYTNLFIPNESVESIISHPLVQGVSLTGSERAGASVASLAGKNIKRSVLELGGNDPFIVLEDADMEKTIDLAVKGRMVNAGQSCVASKRFIVVESVADTFLSGFKEQLAALKLGNPLDEETTLSRMARG